MQWSNAVQLTAGELAAAIRQHIPDFVCDYQPDFRQAIADSWPRSIDDSAARQEWGWTPAYDLAAMTVVFGGISKRFGGGRLRRPPPNPASHLLPSPAAPGEREREGGRGKGEGQAKF